MFRYSIVLFLGLAMASTSTAASWADGMFDELSKDFGSVPRGPTLTYPFRVKNNTKGPVNISSVSVSCGCTNAQALKTYLQPGEETVILAKMDTTRFSGPKTVTIFVKFDRPAAEEVRLWVTANGRSDVTISPEALTFGQIKRGATPEASVTVTFYGMPDLKLTEAKGDSNYVQATIGEAKAANGAIAYDVKAKLRNDTPAGKWYTDVWVKTNNAGLPQVRVPLTVDVAAALSVVPEAIGLGQVKINAEGERRVIIRGAQPFKITKIEGLDEQLTAKDGTEESKQVHILTVKFKGDKAGDVTKKIKIVTDLKEDNEVEIPVNGQIVP